jgi:gamma-glutamylputrescine oxidase
VLFFATPIVEAYAPAVVNPRIDQPPTYYEASTRRPAAEPPLQELATADIAVVGGGLAGLSAALELALRGYQVRLIEADRLGSGASGRNGGQVIAGIAAPQEKLERLLGEADARAVWDISLAGLALLQQRISEYAIDCDWVSGHMHVADKPRQVTELAAWQDELRQRYHYVDTQLLEREELAGQLDSTRYRAALLDRRGGHLQPLRYTLGLARAAQQAGVVIHEQTPLLDYTRTGSGVHLRTAQGELRCRQLVLAGNAGLGATVPELARRILPIGTYMIATEPLGEDRASQLIANNAAVSDMNWILDYFRRSADHRLLFGGRVSYAGLDPAASAPATRQRMLRVYPQLRDVRIDFSWGGWLDITLNRAPHFGRLAPDVWFLQGFSGHGLALTGIAGALVAEAIAGTMERFDVMARIPHRDFPGGTYLRRPALVLAMLWYRLRDLL